MKPSEFRALVEGMSKTKWDVRVAGVEQDSYVAATGPWHRIRNGHGFGPNESDQAHADAEGLAALATRRLALAELWEAAGEVWASIPSTYDEKDPMVQRHARALNALGAALAKLESLP